MAAQSQEPIDRPISERELRTLLGGCGRTTVWRLSRAGALEIVKLGRATRYRMRDMQRLIDEGIRELPRY